MNSYDTLRELIGIDSPSGYTENATDYIVRVLQSYGWSPERTHKGAVRVALGKNPVLSIAAHTDTLGAMVSGVNGNGTLQFTLLGGPLLPTFEGSYVRIYTLGNTVVTGTVLLNNPSAHTNRSAGSTERSTSTMHIRIDEEVHNADDVKKLGIGVGDIICFDTRYQELPNGFIKSHFLDNKAGCYVLFEIARRIAAEIRSVPVELFFSTYEEVGHGGSGGFAPTVQDLLVLDMGVVGDHCSGDEYSCSICAKDSSGPYDYGFRKELTLLAQDKEIPHKVDVYPFYSSDGSLALRAGHDYRVALIGPGVHASHGIERTHKKAVEATIDLCLAYIDKHYPMKSIAKKTVVKKKKKK